MKKDYHLVIVLIAMLYLCNVIVIGGLIAIFCFILHTVFVWKAVLGIALFMTVAQLLFCKLQDW